ncbi:hypothetical protein NDU88_006366 [Pleurodeles waltl]|uniref:Uncharacterized protein n=1 Tax=Pleurodeles waltl TaxID=8319 RepID=A0AAV7WD92_PLEWA|nr:hypothetical protein NDU88_006366 [Pleurodeles waltl]
MTLPPVTKVFLEQLFWVLRDDLATLKQEIEADIKDLKREMAEVRQQFDTVERTDNTQEEEIDQHRREILDLQETN